MKWFLATFIIIYGSLHYYFYYKTKTAFELKLIYKITLSLSLLCLMFAPILTRILERKGYLFSPTLLAYIGYIWMGFLFLFVFFSLIIDIIKLGNKIYNIIFNKQSIIWIAKPTPSFLIIAILCSFIVIYGFFEANNIRIKTLSIKSSKIPPYIKELRISQISDIHLGLTVNKNKLEKIASLIEKTNPDILFATGDMIDADTKNLDQLSNIIKKINPKYGKYAITGNHEFYYGLEKANKFLKDCGFHLIRQDIVNVNEFLTIVGIDDPTAKYDMFKSMPYLNENDLLLKVSQNSFIILLKHRPTVEKQAIGKFDLQLSGHTHKGQIFPFVLFTKMFFSLTGGHLYKFDNSYVYVSPGTGTWGPPIRFLAPPEVTLITIYNDSK